MEKSLKYERQSMWTTVTLLCVMTAIAVVGFYFFDDTGFSLAATCLFSGLTITNAMNSRVIKELKREIESLKSVDSTGSVDPPPPADEPATDE
jgi:hypothetical protein